MLTKTELDARLDPNAEALCKPLLNQPRTRGADVNARRMRRQRREAAGMYRAPTGWSVGLW